MLTLSLGADHPRFPAMLATADACLGEARKLAETIRCNPEAVSLAEVTELLVRTTEHARQLTCEVFGVLPKEDNAVA
jgi:hypothetical protein